MTPALDRDRVSWAAVLAVVGLTLLFRLPWIDVLGLHGDEDISTLAARGIVESSVPRLPSGGLYLRAPFYSYLIAPLVATGIDWLPRLLSVLASTFTAALVVRFGRRLFDGRVALLGGVFYAVSITEIAFARSIRMYAFYELFALLALLFLFRFWRTGTLRAAVMAAAAVVLSLTMHALAATLWIVGLAVVVRGVGRRTQLFAIAATGLFAVAVLAVQAAEKGAIRNGGEPVPVPSSVGSPEVPVALNFAVAADPVALGTQTLGSSLFVGFGLVLLLAGFVVGWRKSEGSEPTRRLLSALGVGLTVSVAGAHQISLAVVLCCVLVVLKAELFADSTGRRLLIGVILSTLLAGVVWTAVGLNSGYEIREVGLALTRWPGRLVRLFLWPPALALLAGPAFVAVLIRSWIGRATDGERFLVLALLLVATSRGLLTGRTHARYLVEVWPLWGLLAAWGGVRSVEWLCGISRMMRARRSVAIVSAVLIAAVFAVLPGTSPPSTFAYLRLVPGDSVANGFGRRFRVADISGAAEWLRPKLRKGDRIVATDWLTTHCYVGRVDAWARGEKWRWQSRLRDGVVREIYLGAEVLPDLASLRRYVDKGPTWILAGANDLASGSETLPPDVREWLLHLTPAYVASDGGTRVFKIGPGSGGP